MSLADHNPSQDPNRPSEPPAGGPPGADQTASPTPGKRRKRRRWPWVILAIVVVLIILILLAPTIISTGPVRSIVIGKINSHLNGTLSVSDMSLGWFSGLSLSGVKVDDAQGRRIAEVNGIRVPISLVSAIGGNYDLHDTIIDKPNLVIFDIYPDGTSTLTQLIKEPSAGENAAPKPHAPASQGPIKLPNVRGKITINDARGTITIHPAAGQKPIPPVFLDSGNIVINIPDINSPITDSIKLVYRVGSSSVPGTINAQGSVAAIHNGQLDTKALIEQFRQGQLPAHLAADQKIEISGANLAPAGALLKSPDKPVDVGGVLSGALQLKADGPSNTASVEGQLNIANFLVGGAPLKGDVYKSATVALPIHITAAQQNGAGSIAIKTLQLQTDQAKVDVSGQVTQTALTNLLARQAPGSSGNLSCIVSTKDLPGLINPLRDVLGVRKDVEIKGGSFNNRIDLAITPDSVAMKQSLEVTATGTSAGQLIQLDPIHLDTGLTALPTGRRIPDLRDLALNLTSAFATARGGGKSLAELHLNGNFDLKKAQDQLAQFMDFGPMTLAGSGTFNVASQGDLTSAGGTSNMSANVTLTNVAVHGLKDGRSLDQPRLVLDASATLKRAGAPATESTASASLAATQPGFIESIPSAKVTVVSGDPNSPVVNLLATASGITAGKLSVEKFDLQKLDIPNLAQAQQSFSAFIPGALRATGGSLSASISGSYLNDTLTFDQKAQVRNLSLEKVGPGNADQSLLTGENEDITASGTIIRSGEESLASAGASEPPSATKITFDTLSASSSNNLFDIKKSGEQPLVVVMKNGAVGGDGQLALSSDLKRVMDVIQAMGQTSGTPAAGASASASGVSASASAGQLTSGRLAATLKLATTDKGSDIHLDGAINDLGVTTNGQPIQNEKVTISVAATTPPDFGGVNVSSAVIGSSFAKATLSDMLVKLGVGPLDMLQSAKLRIAVPDLGKTYAVAQAFSPPSAPPAQADANSSTPAEAPIPPLAIGGGAVVDLDVTRNAATHAMHIAVPQIAASKVSITRGQRKFAFDKLIQLNLTADIATKSITTPASTQPAEAIDQIRVTQLQGDLGGLATLAMPQPITLSGLTGDQTAANGKISLTGSLEPLMRLLSVIQYADPMPYRGDYAINQNVATTSGRINLAGDATINKFIVLGSNNKPAFSEDRVVLADDLVADPTAKSATISNIALTMPTSQAASLTLKGSIADWDTQRTLGNDTKLTLSYDLEKLWPMVKPLLSPSTQDQLKDLKIAGKFDRTFNISGSYPANPPAGTKPLKYLKADGSLAIALLDTSGVDVQDLELPITLENGQVLTVYANRPKAERTAKPAKFNGGTLDLNSLLVDLNGDEPRLSIGKNQKLVAGASINSLLGDTLGKYINPVFTKSKRAKGLLDVTIDHCDALALGQALKTANSGTARITFSLTDMDIANPVGQLMLAPIINGVSKFTGASGTGEESQVFQGYIKNGVINIANGKTTQDVTLELIDRGGALVSVPGEPPAQTLAGNAGVVYMPMKFNGDVDLATQKLLLNLRVPPQLVSKFIPDHDWKKQFNDAFPQGIPGVIRGTTAQPKFEYGNVVAEAVQSIAQRQLLKSIPGIGGNKDKNANGTKDNNNPLGGLLNQITGQGKDQQQSPPPKKKKKR